MERRAGNIPFVRYAERVRLYRLIPFVTRAGNVRIVLVLGRVSDMPGLSGGALADWHTSSRVVRLVAGARKGAPNQTHWPRWVSLSPSSCVA